ncbi:non-hydrolyzing UDP-N-acetylglucosamine 2-epimerase [Hydrogenophaga crassostreae]|uniref:non-hydrolyzing UDP-N-acetylglucosamine 2-epimerase n=1 Tax=Hydrogenophaga crassostreae TaxID=1763535 RepID=UPI0009EDBAD9|nr:UDP-N-acetylglucosamine 2-epimerase (non-hydrolyzing) [Hydrogenophaga crassostreae]
MKILRVVGARPQFMQVAPIRNELVNRGHEHILLHTGQHYDDAMSAVFFRELNIPEADINLGVHGLGHGAMTGRMMEGIEQAIENITPDIVLVDGDTNSTMAAALAAAKLHIPLVHIEAGLRDFDKKRPEEINRIVTDHVASLNCAPIPRALKNLHSEGLSNVSVLTGDVLLDCFLSNLKRQSHRVRQELALSEKGYHLSTLHRPENTDVRNFSRFCDIMNFLSSLDKPVVLPTHPRTMAIIEKWKSGGGSLGSIKLIPPVTYLEMLGLLSGADCVISDSGGVPREAVWVGAKCVMLFREDTWHDLIQNGWATIGKTDRPSIENAFHASKRPDPSETMKHFGNGEASKNIVNSIETFER